MKKLAKKSIKSKVKLLLLLTIFVIALSISLRSTRNITTLEELFKDSTLKINKNIITAVDRLTNKEIPQQDESYIIQKNKNASLEQEITNLKKLLELNKTITEYTPINATIISRNNEYWFNTITLDKGKNSGIETGMAVITSNGLIGKIIKTSKETSEVKLLTTDDVTYKTSVVIKVDDKEHYAILNGYDEQKNLLKVSAIDKNTTISKGDTVLTSGLGQMPQGIYIGTVEKTEIDQYNLGKIVYVKPKQDYNNIHYVTILKVTN